MKYIFFAALILLGGAHLYSSDTINNDKSAECFVCFETYDDEFVTPHTLSCTHEFCQLCLATILSRNRAQLKCPICQALIVLPQNENNRQRALDTENSQTAPEHLHDDDQVSPSVCDFLSIAFAFYGLL